MCIDEKGGMCKFHVQKNFLKRASGRDSGTALVFIWPDQASVPVSQCPSKF